MIGGCLYCSGAVVVTGYQTKDKEQEISVQALRAKTMDGTKEEASQGKQQNPVVCLLAD